MTEKIFDDFMRDKLRNHSTPVPDGLWEKVMNEKKRRPVGILWSSRLLMVGILCIIMLGIGGLMWMKSNDTMQSGSINNNKQKTTDVASTNENKSPQATNNIEVHEKSINLVAEKNASISGYKETNQTFASTKSIAPENNKVLKHETIFIADNKLGINPQQKILDGKQILLTSNGKNINKKINAGLHLDDSNAEKKLSLIQEMGNLEKQETATISSKPFSAGQLMFIPNKIFLSSPHTPLFSFQNHKLPGIVDCPSPNGNARNDWYVELYGSPDYTMKSVKGSAASNAYLQKKDSTETMMMGYTVGGRITKNIGEHLLIKAGLQFSQINERFILRTENERRTTIVITTKNVVDAMGNITTVSDTTTVTQIGYLIKTSNNNYRSIELPLMLGYEFGNDKWKFSVNGGAIVNLASWYKGNTLDTSYQSVSLAKSSGDIYKHTVGVSLYGSMSIIKPLADKLDVFAEPYFRYNLSNLNSTSLGYHQRFSTVGLSLGIRYKFNEKRQRL